ncbi:MAG: DNA-binding response regulator [Bacteroidetes bacterium]|nr:MAG: DNA-binding response regulator [Bacteroidota bacterium]
MSDTPPIRVILADDHPITRQGLRAALDAADGIEVIGEAADGEQALRLTQTRHPDVLILDVEMPRLSGVEVAERLQATGSPVRVLVLSAYDDEEYVYGLLDCGVSGYLMKEEAEAHLIVEAIRGIAHNDGELWISPSLASKLIRRKIRRKPEPQAGLSEREREVLRLVALGYDNQQIADTLFISKHTVKNHIDKIKNQKIGVRTRTELAAWAWQQGLVKPGEDA